MFEDVKQAAVKSSMDGCAISPPAPESITANVLSCCDNTTEEIYARLLQLAEALKPVLQAPYPTEAGIAGKPDCQPLPPFAERLDCHNSRLRSCVNVLTDIRERLAI